MELTVHPVGASVNSGTRFSVQEAEVVRKAIASLSKEYGTNVSRSAFLRKAALKYALELGYKVEKPRHRKQKRSA